MGAFLALVPLLLAQPTPAVDAKPELPPAGPPTAQQVLSHLPPASKGRRAFEGVWAERGPARPATLQGSWAGRGSSPLSPLPQS